ncbi:hypothetical protein [Clostridium felsineum]|uniref:Uncharacterized protein n=1 Tax=Clostridium felsineum TaxID=36839 RepID=A0A1S8L982_9CLOT|nr:hypothetical protein [Clostridium felsineum]URZ02029.1 hypothetical protein CLAUR_020260 [Clostridium felsineum]URZ05149.1 hypothetical protein CLROS_004730 [Clostridium felsineum]URZ10190.1 hypothetical protein CROST_008980 [Clostridium felsineum]
MKKIVTISLCVILLIATFTGCSSKSASTSNGGKTSEKKIPNLQGEWKQQNNKSNDSYQSATISGNTITIYWITDNGKTKSIYWVGSFVAPTTTKEPYSWTSKNDHSKTDGSLLASSDDTKTIKYQNGVLSYEASAMGTTTTVELKKQ